MDGDQASRERLIVGAAVSHFGREPREVIQLEGTAFSSYRICFDGETVIATQRKSFRRTNLEAMILQHLSPICDDVPQYLGVLDGVLFQSDLGANRLHGLIGDHCLEDQVELTAEACAAIFRYQSAARQSGLVNLVPVIGQSQDWLNNLVSSVDTLQLFSLGIPDSFNYHAVAEFLQGVGHNFVKWNCRPQYAVVCDDGFLRWHGFELSGARHGAEDFAWLFGDESWVLDPRHMIAVTKETFDKSYGLALPDFLDFLSVYTTMHCALRFNLIIREAQENGWDCENEGRRKEHPGISPAYAKQLCAVGAFFAERNKLTRALVPNFEQTARVIAAIEL